MTQECPIGIMGERDQHGSSRATLDSGLVGLPSEAEQGSMTLGPVTSAEPSETGSSEVSAALLTADTSEQEHRREVAAPWAEG